MNDIICGDCVEVMKERIDDESIDLVITSPPYGNMRDYTGNDFDFDGIAFELHRVVAKGGVIVWVVGDEVVDGSESGESFLQALFFKDIGFRLHDTMIYEKTGTNYPSKGRYTQIFEYMFVLSKGKPKTWNPIKDVVKKWAGSWGTTTNRQKDGSLKISNSTTCNSISTEKATEDNPIHGYKQRTNVWRYKNGKKFAHTDEYAYKHPATFPESLARDHIITWSNPGDIVLDPLCGSGTTLKMAYLENRQFIGIDASMDYCDLARRRMIDCINRNR